MLPQLFGLELAGLINSSGRDKKVGIRRTVFIDLFLGNEKLISIFMLVIRIEKSLMCVNSYETKKTPLLPTKSLLK
jgi:hypothetical protein